MPVVKFVSPDGSERSVAGSRGTSIMQTAIARGVDGIVGECGGNLMCATCHVYVRPDWLEKIPPMRDDEDEMLGQVQSQRKSNSRLSCQIILDESLDGIVVALPDQQS